MTPTAPLHYGWGTRDFKKSVWQTSWRRYRSTASWTGRLETPGWRRLYTIFTAGWSVGRWWIWFLTETRRHKHKAEKEIELGRDSSEEKKTTKNPFAAWNSVIGIFGAWKTPTLCFSFFFFVFTLWKKLCDLLWPPSKFARQRADGLKSSELSQQRNKGFSDVKSFSSSRWRCPPSPCAKALKNV